MTVQKHNGSVDNVKGESNITLRIDNELRAAIENVARENDRSLSAEIRRAVRAYVEQSGQAA